MNSQAQYVAPPKRLSREFCCNCMMQRLQYRHEYTFYSPDKRANHWAFKMNSATIVMT